ncbi:PREDICTED: uncharacterized protein LOC104820251 [Tarenaya hassleriana]|uniref:uncharacterized protein LOC104820251 n=1 Tax=Tarenaya hassleriana TaxID=28532 RepID=UPI00053C1FBE|nr:PREDICTED: uncharacterized protein LOC104820251 [Tarenaya hassleriana]
MGQQLRRAAGKIKEVERSPSSTSRVAVDRRPPPPEDLAAGKSAVAAASDDASDEARRLNPDNVLEERDPQFDAMLSQMVGRIRAKPGGKAEMGEASVMERSKRPLPKLRNTIPGSGRYEERPAPPGTLNVAQVRHIMLLYQGKADDHTGPMGVKEIAARYKIDESQVQKIVQFLSLPPEDTKQQKKPYQ